MTGFNSRTLGRVRQLRPCFIPRAYTFQFTHPGKGATSKEISIAQGDLRFNSRTLGRVRPPVEATTIALRAGFNSRTLGRVRQLRPLKRHSKPSRFNSRTLGRVRLRISSSSWASCCFNSRTLGRVRRYSLTAHSRSGSFQFTHPGKGATLHQRAFQGCDGVSIHAPWEGCDRLLMARALRGICFNSRTLGRVRRKHHNNLIYQPRVSIHAPWEGCDLALGYRLRSSPRFQFTHPGKGATRHSPAWLGG